MSNDELEFKIKSLIEQTLDLENTLRGNFESVRKPNSTEQRDLFITEYGKSLYNQINGIFIFWMKLFAPNMLSEFFKEVGSGLFEKFLGKDAFNVL